MKTLSLALLATLAIAPVAAAQTNGSDISGNNTASSSIAGGFFVPSNAGTTSVLQSKGMAAAVSRAASAVSNSLSRGTLTSVNGAPISAAAQATVLAAMTGATPDARAAVQAAISAPGVDPAVVTTLMQNLPNLLSNPTPGQVQAVVVAFNQIVKTASMSFLSNPPAEFQALHAAIKSIVSAGRTGAPRNYVVPN